MILDLDFSNLGSTVLPVPGMTANATITTQTVEGALVVPSRAVSGGAAASVVTVRAEGGTEPRAVTTGVTNGTLIQIVSGLEAGEEVMVSSSAGTTSTQQVAQQIAVPGAGGGGFGGGGFGGGGGGGGR